jgi:hypothetical protein
MIGMTGKGKSGWIMYESPSCPVYELGLLMPYVLRCSQSVFKRRGDNSHVSVIKRMYVCKGKWLIILSIASYVRPFALNNPILKKKFSYVVLLFIRFTNSWW